MMLQSYDQNATSQSQWSLSSFNESAFDCPQALPWQIVQRLLWQCTGRLPGSVLCGSVTGKAFASVHGAIAQLDCA